MTAVLFPTSYSELKLYQYQQAARVIQEHRHITDPAEAMFFNCEILSILTGKPQQFFLDLSYKEYEKLIPKLDLFTEAIKVPTISKFKCGGKEFTIIKDVTELRAGDFIDLCEFQKNIEANLHHIIGIVARTPDYCTDVAMKNAEIIQQELTTDIAMHVQSVYCSIMNQIRNSYRGIFGDQEDEPTNSLSWYTLKYGWLLWVDQIAGEDALKADYITDNWSVIRFLNEVAKLMDRAKFNKQKDEMNKQHGRSNKNKTAR